MPADFSGYDVATLHIGNGPPAAKVRRFIAAQRGAPAPEPVVLPDPEEPSSEDDGSNAWALAPSRTKSGKAILLRNPHLAWNAGYYEAQMTVPGVMDFWRLRIGGPLIVIGGFNEPRLGDDQQQHRRRGEIYSHELDRTARPLPLDGARFCRSRGSVPSAETRVFWATPLGFVIGLRPHFHRQDRGDGEFRRRTVPPHDARGLARGVEGRDEDPRGVVEHLRRRAGTSSNSGTRRCRFPHPPHGYGGAPFGAGGRETIHSVRRLPPQPARRLRPQRERFTALRQRRALVSENAYRTSAACSGCSNTRSAHRQPEAGLGGHPAETQLQDADRVRRIVAAVKAAAHRWRRARCSSGGGQHGPVRGRGIFGSGFSIRAGQETADLRARLGRIRRHARSRVARAARLQRAVGRRF